MAVPFYRHTSSVWELQHLSIHTTLAIAWLFKTVSLVGMWCYFTVGQCHFQTTPISDHSVPLFTDFVARSQTYAVFLPLVLSCCRSELPYLPQMALAVPFPPSLTLATFSLPPPSYLALHHLTFTTLVFQLLSLLVVALSTSNRPSRSCRFIVE